MSLTSDNEEKLNCLEGFVRGLIREVLGMELNDENEGNAVVGTCLRCGSTDKRPEPHRCPSCQGEFRLVSGLFGINNMSQLVASIEDLKKQEITLPEFEDRFGVFLETWEQFVASWGLHDDSLPTIFQFDGELSGVYGKLLDELESGIDQLNSALDLIEGLDEGQTGPLAEIEDHVRLFSRKVCSASAGIFTKLESRGGDFSSLLDAFNSF